MILLLKSSVIGKDLQQATETHLSCSLFWQESLEVVALFLSEMQSRGSLLLWLMQAWVQNYW